MPGTLLCSQTWIDAKQISVSNVVLGIGGGVGPSAGIGLHEKIISNTDAGGHDQGHFNVCHVSRASSMADRTKYLLGTIGASPASGMAKAILSIEAAARSTGDFGIAAIPCNTFHAPKLWSELIERLLEAGIDGERLRLVHLIDETIAYMHELAPGCSRIGLMSTTGTRKTGVYGDLLNEWGYTLIEVGYAHQDNVHEAIYNSTWGLKAASPATVRARGEFQRFARDLIEKGAEAIILGCTEIPMALSGATVEGVPLIDPVEAVARALIRFGDVTKLRQLHVPIAIEGHVDRS